MFRWLICAVALSLPMAAHADWIEASSKHFRVYANDDKSDIRHFTKKLEIYDKAMRELWGVPDGKIPATQRLTIYVVSDVASVQQLLPGRSAAGFYEARASGPVAFVPADSGDVLTAAEVLRHEYAHQFMYSNWANSSFPTWFSEGFAEFNATADFRSDGSITFGARPDYRDYGMLRSGTVPLSMLLRPSFEDMSAEQHAIGYSRAWLLTHFLLTQPDQRGQLVAYLKAINTGKSAEEAAKALDGISDMRLNHYIQRRALPAITVDADKLAVGAIELRKLEPGEAAIMPARIASSAGVNEETAPAVEKLARSIAASYPESSAVQRELAEAAFDAEDFKASEAAAQRALAANAENVDALLYRGMAAMAVAWNNNGTDAKRWEEIRQWFLKANKLDTENPRALQLFYESFEAAKQEPTKNAKSALLYAYALAPYSMDLRLMAAKVLLEMGEGKAAQTALKPVAYSPHASPVVDIAQAALKELSSAGPDAAADLLQKKENALRKQAAEQDSEMSS
ncbi:DUF1570 domain-containing protein [Stakelama saccharophila]|uniref:DUF1570 domain-containing protein n=1 Tax=Stakelama saccharophila TaxID=3075605 RepID=A0ABZ0B922_9SPHN|nr:DUF1570 domain-containing protein [Stakelama sp. W311]WNO53348.1 DUF1570 domain-containing protein [Stakelama sp. W311]